MGRPSNSGNSGLAAKFVSWLGSVSLINVSPSVVILLLSLDMRPFVFANSLSRLSNPAVLPFFSGRSTGSLPANVHPGIQDILLPQVDVLRCSLAGESSRSSASGLKASSSGTGARATGSWLWWWLWLFSRPVNEVPARPLPLPDGTGK